MIYLLSQLSPQKHYLLIFFLLEQHVILELDLLLAFLGNEKTTKSLQRNLCFPVNVEQGNEDTACMLPFFAEWWTKYYFSSMPIRIERHVKMDETGAGWINLWYLNYLCHIYEFFIGQITVPSFHSLLSFFIHSSQFDLPQSD